MEEAKWYVIHTYSGFENKVKADIEKTVVNRSLQDQILEVVVPVEKVTDIRNGVKKIVEHKLFPCYVFLHMIMNDDTWYIVRNTRSVTGFVGPGSKPEALLDEDVIKLGLVESTVVLDFVEGDEVIATSGAFMNSVGKVVSINTKKETVTVIFEMFNRDVSVELDFTEVKKK